MRAIDIPEEDQPDAAAFDTALDPFDTHLSDEEDAADTARVGLPWLTIALALVAATGWTALFALSRLSSSTETIGLDQIVEAVGLWALPIVLIAVLVTIRLLVRASNPARLHDHAGVLADSAAALEQRLIAVNRELSLAREFLNSQARDLQAVGRQASERLIGVCSALESAIGTTKADIERIGSVGETAVANMERLRDDLPVIASSARDVANRFGQAGDTARDRLDEMVSGMDRLNTVSSEHQSALDRLDDRARTLADDAETRWLELERTTRERGERLAADMEEAQRAMTVRETDATDTLQARIATLRDQADQFDEQVADRNRTLATMEADAAAQLEARVAAIQNALETARRVQDETAQRLAADSDTTLGKLADLTERLGQLRNRADQESALLQERSSLIAGHLDESRATVSLLQDRVEGLTGDAARLLALIEESVERGQQELPAAFDETRERLEWIGAEGRSVLAALANARAHSERVAERLETARGDGASIDAWIDGLAERTADARQTFETQAEDIVARLRTIEGDSQATATRAAEALGNALGELEARAHSLLALLGEDGQRRITETGETLSRDLAETVAHTLRRETREALSELNASADRAGDAGRAAALALRDQLAKVNELAGNLETRVAIARERAEERVDDDFARRAALVTESLNSAAIDITKSLSTEIADTAWAAYLKGDRSVFTRRATALLDHSEAREIAQLYETDPEFQRHVNRYIHDFEGMLRMLLSTRDGNALGVTLLSSDMGRLYVAMAQALERLRV